MWLLGHNKFVVPRGLGTLKPMRQNRHSFQFVNIRPFMAMRIHRQAVRQGYIIVFGTQRKGTSLQGSVRHSSAIKFAREACAAKAVQPGQSQGSGKRITCPSTTCAPPLKQQNRSILFQKQRFLPPSNTISLNDNF